MITISICIPHYNNPDLLKRCLSSLRPNNCKFDVIIVDDYSNLNSKISFQKVVNDCQNFLDIKVFYNSRNMGVTYSKNKAFLKSGSYWCVFLDCDDYLIPRGIEKLQSFIENYPYDLIFLHCVDSNSYVPKHPEKISLKKYIHSGTGSEALTVVKKSFMIKRPYLSFLRGYEGIGIMINSYKNKLPIVLANIAIRIYTNDSLNRLSSRSGFLSRLNYLALGHMICFRRFWRYMSPLTMARYLFLSFSYFLISKLNSKQFFSKA